MAQHEFPALFSNSQATLICYRGPGCPTQYLFEGGIGIQDDTVPTLADAHALAFEQYRDQCKGFVVENLSETPFGDLTRRDGTYTGGHVQICTGNVPDGTYSECNLNDHLALVYMTGPEGSLRVDTTVFQLFSIEPVCVGGVQVVSGDCTWFGTSVICGGTEAAFGLSWQKDANDQACCGRPVPNLADTECTGTSNALEPETCQNDGPPLGFETDPDCVYFDQFNSNLPRGEILNPPSFLSVGDLCDSYVVDVGTVAPTDADSAAPTVAPSDADSAAPTVAPSDAAATSTPTADPTGVDSNHTEAPTLSPIGMASTAPTTTPTARSPTGEVENDTEEPSVPSRGHGNYPHGQEWMWLAVLSTILVTSGSFYSFLGIA